MMKRSTVVMASLLVALLGLPVGASAQTKPAEPAEASLQPEGTTATYQDWLLRCAVSAEKVRACEIVQNLQAQGQQGLVASVALGKIDPKGPLRLVVQVPPGVWLPAGVKVQISERAKPLQLEYKRCPQGCFAELELDAAAVQALRSATDAGSFTFEDGARRPITLPLSFKGFVPALGASLKG